MKLLITGSRNFHDYEGLKDAVEAIKNELNQSIEMILHGGAAGSDNLAQRYALEQGIEVRIIRPDYERYYYKVAPLKRNEELVTQANAVLALYGKQGRKGGTYHTAHLAIKTGKHLCERLYDGQLKHYKPVEIF